MPFVRAEFDVDDFVRRYAAGETCQDLAREYGVSDTTLRRRLKDRGVSIRQGPSYRTTDTYETRVARAKTRERLMLHAGPHEDEFAAVLDAASLEYVQQRAFGPYNVDFALVVAPIAVEVVTGGGNRRSAALRRKRTEDLLEAGWHVVECFYRYGAVVTPFTDGAAQYLIAFADRHRRDPAARREHRMVWGNGQEIAPRSRQVN